MYNVHICLNYGATLFYKCTVAEVDTTTFYLFTQTFDILQSRIPVVINKPAYGILWNVLSVALRPQPGRYTGEGTPKCVPASFTLPPWIEQVGSF